MIITFCGHSDFCPTVDYEKRVLALLDKLVGDSPAYLYLGGYGAFDEFAYACGKKFKEKNKNARLVFITPYITLEYQKNHLSEAQKKYDEIIYPDIENAPLKFAISYRNRWMVDNSDIVISYITRTTGGAYKTYKYAVYHDKTIYNLFDFR